MIKKQNAVAPPVLVPSGEERKLTRTLLQWLNACPELPAGAIRYEHLGAGEHAMAFHVEQSAYKTARYILGGYRAQLRFSLFYRFQPGDSGLERIEADEALNAIGDWACANLPALGDGCRAVRLDVAHRAAAMTAWDNGDEDHSINMTLIYEVL